MSIESNETILKVEKLSKTHHSAAGDPVTVLENVSFTVESGTSMAIVGPSGSGKTTLLGLCAGLDLPSSGVVWLRGQRLDQLSEDGRARLRSREVGFVFQNFQLLPGLTALENVMAPLEIQGIRRPQPQAAEVLTRVGLKARLHHFPHQLSGGEQQRVAIARAFIHRPALLFADEPTGNLDHETSLPIVEMLLELKRDFGSALLLITHDHELADRCDRMIRLKGGKLAENTDHAHI